MQRANAARRNRNAPRIVHFLQLLRHDGLPPFPLETVRRRLRRAFFVALGSPAHELDERAVEIKRCDARRRARREMHAMETAAGWAKRGFEPPKCLLIRLPVALSSLLEDWKDWPSKSKKNNRMIDGLPTFGYLGIGLVMVLMRRRTTVSLSFDKRECGCTLGLVGHDGSEVKVVQRATVHEHFIKFCSNTSTPNQSSTKQRNRHQYSLCVFE